MTEPPLSFRPYARLLTMLGDQLIKNERIALVELIKNAYDADATRVEVRIEGFEDDTLREEDAVAEDDTSQEEEARLERRAPRQEETAPDDRARIVVRDDGCGMSLDTIRNAWMNPATPRKYLAKKKGKRRTPRKNRVVQGEKGIGRFATFKLGKIVTLTTREMGSELETVLVCDFSRYDDDFIEEDGREREVFLEDLAVEVSQRVPKMFPGAEHGTVVEIRALRSKWTEKMINDLCRDVSNLTDPVSRFTGRRAADRFGVDVFCNGDVKSIEDEGTDRLRWLIEEKPVLAIKGRFDSEENVFLFKTQDGADEIDLRDPRVRALWVWRQRLREGSVDAQTQYVFGCGDFSYSFFMFDFARDTAGRYSLTPREKEDLKGHRVYLYRDGVRVYPYGDKDDDWLQIDVSRGTGRAGDFFSNDQTIGWIDITQKQNPSLRDKTNREGLIETGGAAEDFIFLVRVFLSFVKQHHYARYQAKKIRRRAAEVARGRLVGRELRELKKVLRERGETEAVRRVTRIEKAYRGERSHLVRRAEMTEDLAGVGLSVEMASHDIMLLMSRAQDIARRLVRTTRGAGLEEARDQADMLIGVLQQMADGLSDVQRLFTGGRGRSRKVLRIETILEKIHRIYRPVLEKRGIGFRRINVGQSPLTARTTDGVVMQVLINLFDNATFWLDRVDRDDRRILVTMDGERHQLVFSDNGPGVHPDDLPYIFEPFYSAKGEEGRGLGLYIARQLLERHEYRLAVAETEQELLSGANFVVSFAKGGN